MKIHCLSTKNGKSISLIELVSVEATTLSFITLHFPDIITVYFDRWFIILKNDQFMQEPRKKKTTHSIERWMLDVNLPPEFNEMKWSESISSEKHLEQEKLEN